MYAQWRFRSADVAETWRRWRRLPAPAEELFPSRVEAVEAAFALYAGQQERMIADIAEAFANRGSDGAWSKAT